MDLSSAIDGVEDVLWITSAYDLDRAFSSSVSIKTLLIQPKDPEKFVDFENKFATVVNLIELRQVKTLVCHKVDFIQIADRRPCANHVKCLRIVKFTSCANLGFMMRYILAHCPNLQCLQELGPKLATLSHTASNREVTQTTIWINEKLQTNYKLCEFHYDRLEARIVDFPTQNKPAGLVEASMQAAYDRLMNTRQEINQYLERNRQGYRKCQKAIYQLFLIKRFAVGDPFKALNRDVVRLIARMLYSTIGTKIWCS